MVMRLMRRSVGMLITNLDFVTGDYYFNAYHIPEPAYVSMIQMLAAFGGL